MSANIITPTIARERGPFEWYCLSASVVIFVMGLAQDMWHIDRIKTNFPQGSISDKVIFIVSGLAAVLAISFVPYVLGLLVARKRSRVALLLLVACNAIGFFMFLGAAGKYGLFAFPTFQALIPTIIISVSFIALRNQKR